MVAHPTTATVATPAVAELQSKQNYDMNIPTIQKVQKMVEVQYIKTGKNEVASLKATIEEESATFKSKLPRLRSLLEVSPLMRLISRQQLRPATRRLQAFKHRRKISRKPLTLLSVLWVSLKKR